MNQPKQPNQDAQFPQPPYPYYPYHADDEISLVDLAKILVHRKYVFFITWALIFLLSLAYVFYNSPKESTTSPKDLVAFTSSLSIGYKTPTIFIEPMASIQTLIQDVYVPYARENSEVRSIPLRVNFQDRRNINEESSNVMQLVSIASKDQQASVEKLHETIVSRLIERHEQISEQLLLQIQADNNAQILPTSLASLAVPIKVSAENTLGARTKLILALGLVLGFIIAIIMAFTAEFIARVKTSIKEDQQPSKTV